MRSFLFENRGYIKLQIQRFFEWIMEKKFEKNLLLGFDDGIER